MVFTITMACAVMLWCEHGLWGALTVDRIPVAQVFVYDAALEEEFVFALASYGTCPQLTSCEGEVVVAAPVAVSAGSFFRSCLQ